VTLGHIKVWNWKGWSEMRHEHSEIKRATVRLLIQKWCGVLKSWLSCFQHFQIQYNQLHSKLVRMHIIIFYYSDNIMFYYYDGPTWLYLIKRGNIKWNKRCVCQKHNTPYCATLIFCLFDLWPWRMTLTFHHSKCAAPWDTHACQISNCYDQYCKSYDKTLR
jgi:hypothetical protein